MRWRSALLAAMALSLAACGRSGEEPIQAIPDESLTQPPVAPELVEITDDVSETRDALLRYAR
ncbi:hypothetical protein, partial [Hyphomonas sp.]|uniref:hypothetical protein n=1 Tax=Hyphomonas sp. TaxID=87 RepID=UPI0030F4EBBE